MARKAQRGEDQDRDPIQRRLIDDQQTDREDVLGAASDAFVQDQEDPDHSSRVERRQGNVDDPSHSRGSPRERS